MISQAVGRLVRAPQFLAQSMLGGEREFHAAGAAANDHDAKRAVARARPVHNFFPAAQEGIDRLDRQYVLVGAGDIDDARVRTGIDGEHVKRHERPAATSDCLVRQVDPLDLGVIQTRARKQRQRTQVDMRLIEIVVSRDVTGQHARIRRVNVARNQGNAQTGDRLHAETLDHRQVAVTAADEHQILHDGAVCRTVHVVSTGLREPGGNLVNRAWRYSRQGHFTKVTLRKIGVRKQLILNIRQYCSLS